MAPQVVRLYNQMPEPKYVIAMGACAISGGPFKQGYNVLKELTDIYLLTSISRLPPAPEAWFSLDGIAEEIDQQPSRRQPAAASEGECAERVPGAGVWEHDLEP